MIFPAKALGDFSWRRTALLTARDRKRPRRLKMRFISDGFLFVRIFAFAAAVPYLLRMRLSRVADALEPGRDPSAVDEDLVRKIAGYVEIAIRHGRPFVRPGCLTRGLTRYYFLRRAGVDVALCFGMGRLTKEFIGHCWLVRDGEPFLEAEDPRLLYAEMYRISRLGGQAPAPVGGTGGLWVSES
jgi:Transglutaminase-like superfamily